MMFDSESTHKLDAANIAAALAEFNKQATSKAQTPVESSKSKIEYDDLAALYDISKAVNSTLILDDILDIVMTKSVNLLQAERGFLMLLDDQGKLQFKTAHNINKEQLNSEDLRISTTIANMVVRTGKSIYTSDALNDERFLRKASIVALNIRSAMCVPLRIKTKIIGVVYLDNSSQTNIFLKHDLALFEMFADQAALAIHNARLYSEVLELQKHQQNIIASTPIGLLVVDKSHLISAINEAAQRIFMKIGWITHLTAETKFDGLKVSDIVPEKYLGAFIENLSLSNDKPAEISRFNIDFHGDESILKLRFCPYENYQGEKAGHIILIEDITDQVVLEQYLILSEKLIGKGEMAAAIGHELNNYLTVISTNAQLAALNLSHGNYDNLKNKIDVIVKNVDRIKRFTDGLMDFSTLESKPVPYDFGRLVEELVFLVKPQPKFKRVTFSIDIAPNLPQLFIDVGQIHQVLLNLFNNCADAFAEHCSGEGQITIAAVAAEDKKTVLITVADNGPGIPSEILPRLFEPHLTTKKAGHGLGLSTCLRIINNHSGKIRAYNHPQGGAVFEIELGLAPNLK